MWPVSHQYDPRIENFEALCFELDEKGATELGLSRLTVIASYIEDPNQKKIAEDVIRLIGLRLGNVSMLGTFEADIEVALKEKFKSS